MNAFDLRTLFTLTYKVCVYIHSNRSSVCKFYNFGYFQNNSHKTAVAVKLFHKGSEASARQSVARLGLTFPPCPIFSAIEKAPKILHEQELMATQFFCFKKIIRIY